VREAVVCKDISHCDDETDGEPGVWAVRRLAERINLRGQLLPYHGGSPDCVADGWEPGPAGGSWWFRAAGRGGIKGLGRLARASATRAWNGSRVRTIGE